MNVRLYFNVSYELDPKIGWIFAENPNLADHNMAAKSDTILTIKGHIIAFSELVFF